MFKYDHPILLFIGVLIMYGYWTISYHLFNFLVKHIGVAWLKRIRHLSIAKTLINIALYQWL